MSSSLGKKSHVIPITSMLGKLPTVHSGENGSIPYQYSGINSLNRSNAHVESAPGSGNGSQMYFVNSWAMRYSRRLARSVNEGDILWKALYI